MDRATYMKNMVVLLYAPWLKAIVFFIYVALSMGSEESILDL